MAAPVLHLCFYSVLVLALYTNYSLNQVNAAAAPVQAPGPAPIQAPGPAPPTQPPKISPPPPPPKIAPPPPPPPPPPTPPPPTPKKKGSKGRSGGQKAGIVFGVLIGVGLLGFAAYVYKIRNDNVRRARYGAAARGSIL